MKFKQIPASLLIISALLLAMAGCGDETNSQGELVIQAIDQSTDPFGDVQTSEGTIPTDTIDITLFNEPKNPYSVDSGNFADIVISSISVIFSRIDGGEDVPASFNVPYTLRVPYNGTATIQSFPVLPGTLKDSFPISDLLSFGYERSTLFTSIRMQITIEIVGKTTTEDPVFVRGFTTVEVTNWAD